MRRHTHRFVVILALLSFFVAAIYPALPVSASPLSAPTILPTMTDTIIGDDGDSKADPGETIEYTVTIPNSGTDATGVTFTDIIDVNTTLVGGSVNVSPLAINDSYDTIGNTLLEVGVTPGSDPAVRLSGGLLGNDVEFLGDAGTFNITSHTNPANGTLVTFNNNGTFSYLPNAGFSGIDTFTYTLTDSGGLTDIATVTITVTVQKVWYVKNNAAAGGSGRSTAPFTTLFEAETASSINDTIYVFQGNGTTSGQNTGIILKSGQRLLGEGVALTVPVSVNGGANPTTLRSAGSQPQIDNTGGSGFGVSVPNASGVQIFGLNIAGSTNAVNVTTSGANSGGFEFANNTVRSSGASGVDVNGGGSGTLTVSLHDNTITSTGSGIDIQRTAGTINIIAFDDNVVTGNTGGSGINIVGPSVTFDGTPGGAFQTVSGGTTTVGQPGNGVGASGLVLTSVAGDLLFTDLDIYADNGSGLVASGTAVYSGATGVGFQVSVPGSVATIAALNGPAVNLNLVTASLPFAEIDSTNSSSTGVSLTSVLGSFSAGTSSSISNPTGTDFVVSSSNATIMYSGSITDGAGAGINLSGNTGSTITFNGGISLSSGSSTAFSATGGGTVNVCDENPCNPASTGGLVNSLTTTTGTALTVTDTTIGSNGLTFRSISSNGSPNGIVLDTTGTSGGLTVTGAGSANSGGMIQNTTGDGISLYSTSNISLDRIRVENTGGDGISGEQVHGFRLTNSAIVGAGDGDEENGIIFSGATDGSSSLGVDGTVRISDTLIDGSNNGTQWGLRVYNNQDGATLNMTLLRLTVQNNQDSGGWIFGEDAVSMDIYDGTANVLVDDSDFLNTAGMGLRANAGDSTAGESAVLHLTAQNNTFTNNHALPSAMSLTTSSNATGRYTATGNVITGPTVASTGSMGIDLDAAVSSTLDAILSNNTMNVTYGTGLEFIVNENAIGRLQASSNTINLDPGNVNPATQQGMNFQARALASGQTGQEHLTLTTNTITGIDSSTFGFQGMNFQSGSSTAITHNNLLCANVSGNSVSGSGSYAYSARQRANTTFQLQGLTGTPVTNEVTVQNFIKSNNPAGTITGNTTVAGAGGTTIVNYTAAACQTPATASLPVAMLGDTQTIAQAPTDSFAVAPGSTVLSRQPSTHTPGSESFAFAPSGGGKPLFVPVRFTPALSGETINVTIGALPAGESVKIKFRVTVNGPTLPPGTTQISNQATVSGSNFTDLLTDDPAAAGAIDPTITPVDRPDTTVTSINRAASSPTDTASVSWTVTFANAVSGLASSNFTLVNGGLGGSPAITAVTAVGATPATQWTVTASTGTGNGTLGLNLVNDTGLSHDLTNLSFTGEVYTVDQTAPTITNVTSSSQPGCILNASTTYCNEPDVVSIQIAFNESVHVTTTGGTPTLALNSGGAASYVSGSGSNTLTFTYTVAAGQNSSDLEYSSTSALALNGGTIEDTATNSATLTLPAPGAAGSLSANTALVVDTTAPAVSYFHRSAPATSPTSSDTLQFEVDFSEPIGAPGSFGTDDFVLTGTTATISGVGVADVNAGTYYVSVGGGDLSNLNGTVRLNFSPGMLITDRAGNPVPNTDPSDDETYVVDNAAPGVTIDQAAGQADPTNSGPINFTVTFSEAVPDFATGDVDLSASTAPGTLTGVVTGGPTMYNVAVSGMTGNGTVVASISAGVATDGVHLNMASTSTDNTVTYDTSGPTVTIDQAAGQADPAGSGPVNFTVVFSEAMTGFATGDVDLSASTAPGTLTGTVTGGPTTYNVAVSGMTGDGTIVASIPAGAATDGINSNAVSTSTDNSVLYDTTDPGVTIDQAIGQADPTSGAPISFTVVFSEAVTDFATGDVTLNGPSGPLTGTVTGGPTTYNVAVSGMVGSGTITASIASGVAHDLASRPNTVSTSSDNTVVYDTTAPSVMINHTVGQGDPTSAVPIHFEVVFSESVSGFGDSASDVTLSGTAGATTAAVTGGPITYNVAVSGMTSSGTVIASIPAGAAHDAANNNTTASTSIDNSVSYVYDTTPPVVVAVLRADPNPSGDASVDFTVTFSKAVTGVDVTDFALTTTGVTGASVSSVSGSGATYTVTVLTGSDNGTIRLNVEDDDTIQDAANNRLGDSGLGNGNYAAGEAYTIVRTGGADTVGVYRPTAGMMYLKHGNTSGFADLAILYGLPDDYPVVGDWDGDGDATICIYRNGIFYLRNSNSLGLPDVVFHFGVSGDQPVVGDWDGDGVDSIGVYRNGTFFLRNSNASGAPDMIFALGNPGDVGIAGDWDGDGLDTTGVFRPANGMLYLKNTNVTGFADIQINYGIPGDKPVIGDWNDDGVDTIGVYRRGTYYLRNSNTVGFADVVFDLGIPGDMPLAGNWDGLP